MTIPNIKELFLDANILVYYTNSQTPQHLITLETVNQAYQAGIKLIVSPQILREYVVANTKYIKNNPSLTFENIRVNFEIMLKQFRIVDDNLQVLNSLNNLLKNFPTAGRRVYDVNIVATMQNYGIQHLLTNNPADFGPFASIITVIPL